MASAAGGGGAAADGEQWHLRAPVEGNPIVFFGACCAASTGEVAARAIEPGARAPRSRPARRATGREERERARGLPASAVSERCHSLRAAQKKLTLSLKNDDNNDTTQTSASAASPRGACAWSCGRTSCQRRVRAGREQGGIFFSLVFCSSPRLKEENPFLPPLPPKNTHTRSRELPAVLHGRVHARGQAHRIQGAAKFPVLV